MKHEIKLRQREKNMRIMTYRCDECKKETTALGLPLGWLEVKFWNQRDYYYHFCGYPCLVQWSERRETFYGNKFASNEGFTAEEVSTGRPV